MPLNEREIFWDFQAVCIQRDIECQKELVRYIFEGFDEVSHIFHEGKGRSYKRFLEETRQATERALALRQPIQDPKAGGDMDVAGQTEIWRCSAVGAIR